MTIRWPGPYGDKGSRRYLLASLDQSLRRMRLDYKARALNGIAIQRGQTLAQMALAWGLRRPVVTSALTGASRVRQIKDCVAALNRPDFTADELAAIEAALR
jgi:L-glyceraldehyde 3-phosphate reductase